MYVAVSGCSVSDKYKPFPVSIIIWGTHFVSGFIYVMKYNLEIYFNLVFQIEIIIQYEHIWLSVGKMGRSH